MPSYQDYERDYHAGDRDEVLAGIKQWGTDDRSKWGPQDAAAPPPQGQPPPAGTPPPAPPQGGQGFDRTAFRDAWMATGADKATQDRLLQQYNLQMSPNGTVTLPTGEMIDLRIGARAGGTQASWTNAGGTQNGVPVTGMGGGGGNPAGNYGAGWSQSGPVGGVSNGGTKADELYNMLMTRAKQGTAVDRNDPNIRAQADPYAANVERSSRNYLADAAEGLGPLANMRGERRVAAEHTGQATGLFESQLIGREISARRDEIQQALNGAQGMLSEQQRLALQRELGIMNDATQRYGIDSGERTAQGQLGLGRDRLGLDYSELDWRMDPRNPANLPR